LAIQPFNDARVAIRPARGGNHIGIEDVDQKVTSRGWTCPRGTSWPGNART
jgi:hypothetical protein